MIVLGKFKKLEIGSRTIQSALCYRENKVLGLDQGSVMVMALQTWCFLIL